MVVVCIECEVVFFRNATTGTPLVCTRSHVCFIRCPYGLFPAKDSIGIDEFDSANCYIRLILIFFLFFFSDDESNVSLISSFS